MNKNYKITTINLIDILNKCTSYANFSICNIYRNFKYTRYKLSAYLDVLIKLDNNEYKVINVPESIEEASKIYNISF